MRRVRHATLGEKIWMDKWTKPIYLLIEVLNVIFVG